MTGIEVIEKIGPGRVEEFLYFMRGQTFGINIDGSVNFFEKDVDNFLRLELERFFD